MSDRVNRTEHGGHPPAEGSSDHVGSGWNLRPASLTPESADPLLGALLALCRLHGRPRSAASLTSGLPLEDNRLTPELFTVAAERARLSARLVRRKFADIQPHLFPVVLLLKGRATYVVLREVKRDQFEVLVPETGSGTEVVSRRHIEERYDGYAFLARPEISYRGQTEVQDDPPQGHWFWSTLRRMGRVYVYVILAAIMVNLFALAGPLFTMNVYDRVVPNQALETLWVLATGILVVYGFDFFLKMIRAYLIDHTGKRADVVMSSIIFSHALNVRMGSRPASSGAFASKLKEFEAVRDFFASATVVAIVDIPFIFLFIAVVFMIAGPAAYIPLVAVPVVIIGGLLIQAPLRNAVKKTNAGNAHKHGVLIEAIAGLDTIKSLGAEGRMQRDWEAYSGESAQLGARVKFLSGLGIHFAQFIQQAVTVGVVIVGVYQIANNDLTMGGLIASTILTGRIMAPLGQIAGLVARLHHAAAARASIDEIMNLPVDRPAGKQFLSRPALAGRISFQDVSFFYPDTQTPAVKGLSFSVDPGERLAIMGPIGSGKSTIARLLTRLYDPTEGSVQIDGADIQQIDPADIRRTAGVVLQDVILFTGTVRENIAMGAPEADDEMILRAAELSGAHDFISRHPLGYDMPVGERGSLLSGGQRQAVALARALLPDPPILVLDEPTSMMDMPAEEAFVERLSLSLKDKALIIITHRPTLLNIADRLLVLRRGEAIADGPVAEVLPKLGTKTIGAALPDAETIKQRMVAAAPGTAPEADKRPAPTPAPAPSPAPVSAQTSTPAEADTPAPGEEPRRTEPAAGQARPVAARARPQSKDEAAAEPQRARVSSRATAPPRTVRRTPTPTPASPKPAAETRKPQAAPEAPRPAATVRTRPKPDERKTAPTVNPTPAEKPRPAAKAVPTPTPKPAPAATPTPAPTPVATPASNVHVLDTAARRRPKPESSPNEARKPAARTVAPAPMEPKPAPSPRPTPSRPPSRPPSRNPRRTLCRQHRLRRPLRLRLRLRLRRPLRLRPPPVPHTTRRWTTWIPSSAVAPVPPRARLNARPPAAAREAPNAPANR